MGDVILDLDAPVRIDGDEDEETLAAIDEGLKAVREGRTVDFEEVERMVAEWTSGSYSPNPR